MPHAHPGAGHIHASAKGIRLPLTVTKTLDVLFDGQRIWSFNPQRDGKAASDGHLVIGWPAPLRPFLDGRCGMVLREHVSGRVLFDETVRFGSGTGPVSVVDRRGDALAVDKTGRLVRMFSDSDGANLERLVEETERLLTLLNDEGGVPSYLSYGGLLGAVRSGHMIGHDCDLDIAFLSDQTQPADIILESYRLERLVRRHGWSTRRMSGDDFKVVQTMDDGSTIGIDVFGSFYVDGVFHLMPETRGELPSQAIVPLSKVELEGRQITAPADPEALLALTYGESWRVPDPAFKFATPRSTQRRLTGWMRGERANLRHWDKVFAGPADPGAPEGPSLFAEWVAERLPEGGRMVDLGAGSGHDSIYFAQQGHDVVGYDYSGSALKRARQQRSGLENVHLRFLRLNLYEKREVLAHAGLRAHRGRTEAIYARQLLETLREDGRSNLWTYARMVLRGGGLLFLEFCVPVRAESGQGGSSAPTRYLEPETVVAEIEAAGGVVEQREVKRGPAGSRRSDDPAVCRLVVRWS